MTDVNNIAFLGLCDRAHFEQHTGKWNIIGLSYNVYSLVFPMVLSGFHIGLSFKDITHGQTFKIRIANVDDKEVATLTFKTSIEQNPPNVIEEIKKYSMKVNGWTNLFMPLNIDAAVIETPGVYKFTLLNEAKETTALLGEANFIYTRAPTLTPERITALKSDPSTAKYVEMQLGCKHCDGNYSVYASLERQLEKENDKFSWYENSVDEFICNCGKTKLPLIYVRENLHALLSHSAANQNNVSIVPLYETTALINIRINFLKLLKSNPKEEIFQKFIENNLILLHQFPSRKIIFKAPIFSKYKTDFAILTAQKELLLIEIESSSTPLMKNNGHHHSKLNHAIEQVRDWLNVADEHRMAFLNDLKIDSKDVTTIKGVVIAGRNQGYDAEKLRLLKMANHGRISFLTYDDLLISLDTLIERFSKI